MVKMEGSIWILLGALVIVLLLVIGLVGIQAQTMRKRSRRQMQEWQGGKQGMQAQLQKEQERMMLLWKDQLQSLLLEFQSMTQQQIMMMSRSVSSDLQTSMQTNNQMFQQVLEQVARVDESSKTLRSLSETVHDLQLIFHDKKARGIYGEVELYALMRSVYGEEGMYYRKQMKLSSGVIADCVLLHQAGAMICIDSKFPLENYRRMMAAGSKEEEARFRKLFAADVKKQIVSIAEKYIIPDETAEFAYLFIPAEAIFAYIHAHLPALVEEGYGKRVYLASPSTLMAYLSVMKSVYLDHLQSEHIEEIKRGLKRLGREFERFEQRYQSVVKDYEKTYQDFHALSITVRKLNEEFHKVRKGEDA